MVASSLLMQTRWSFAADIVTGQYSRAQEVAHHRRPVFAFPSDPGGTDDGYTVVVTRSKVRGRGHVLQMTFRSEREKDFEILGWGVVVNKNQGD